MNWSRSWSNWRGSQSRSKQQTLPDSFRQRPKVAHPEKTYGRAADIWSLGCTVLELLTRQMPFPSLEWQKAFISICMGKQLSIPDHISFVAQDFIRKCVQVDSNCRNSAAQLLEHPFVTRRPLETY